MRTPLITANFHILRAGSGAEVMSGFTGGDLLVLNQGWALIDKPFVPKRLVEMVNAFLHTRDKAQGNHQFDSRKDVAGE